MRKAPRLRTPSGGNVTGRVGSPSQYAAIDAIAGSTADPALTAAVSSSVAPALAAAERNPQQAQMQMVAANASTQAQSTREQVAELKEIQRLLKKMAAISGLFVEHNRLKSPGISKTSKRYFLTIKNIGVSAGLVQQTVQIVDRFALTT